MCAGSRSGGEGLLAWARGRAHRLSCLAFGGARTQRQALRHLLYQQQLRSNGVQTRLHHHRMQRALSALQGFAIHPSVWPGCALTIRSTRPLRVAAKSSVHSGALTQALAVMEDSVASQWNSLANGILVVEYGVTIPWHISRDELYSLIAQSSFSISVGGCWPELEFSLFGFRAVFGFNFVSDPLERLTEIQYMNYHPRKLRRTFRKSGKLLPEALGRPNIVDSSRRQQTWRRDGVQIQNYVSKTLRTPSTTSRAFHMLSIRSSPRLDS